MVPAVAVKVSAGGSTTLATALAQAGPRPGSGAAPKPYQLGSVSAGPLQRFGDAYIEYGSEVHPSAARKHTFRPQPGDSSASDSPVISHWIPEYLVIGKPASAYRGPPAATNEAPRVHGVYKNLHPRYVEYESGICWMRERTAAAHARELTAASDGKIDPLAALFVPKTRIAEQKG